MNFQLSSQALARKAGRKVARSVKVQVENSGNDNKVAKLQKLTPFLYAGIAGIIAAEPAHAGLLTINYTLPIEWVSFTLFMLYMEKNYFNPVLGFIKERDMFIRRQIAERERAIAEAERVYQEALAAQEAKIKAELDKKRKADAAAREQREKQLEEQKKQLAAQMRQQQFEMADLYEALVKEMAPVAEQLKAKIESQVDQYKDIDKCIANFPTSV